MYNLTLCVICMNRGFLNKVNLKSNTGLKVQNYLQQYLHDISQYRVSGLFQINGSTLTPSRILTDMLELGIEP